ncbi:MAG: exodeoxyribonuclease III [Pseudomonadota bacterium]
MALKLASWNVNSIRSRIEHVLLFLNKEDPDILLLQETKCEDVGFPEESFLGHPYNISKFGQKSYNGVAVLSKMPVDEIKTNFPGNPCEDQARFIEITCQTSIGYTRIISVYVPNGGSIGSDKFAIKLQFYDALTNYLTSIKRSDEHLIIGGDFNVSPFDIDVYSPQDCANTLCFSGIEKNKFRSLLNSGFEDLYRLYAPHAQEFSWWDYRAGAFAKDLGLRIDMILASPHSADMLLNCYIAKYYRTLEKPSDHAPVVAVFGSTS